MKRDGSPYVFSTFLFLIFCIFLDFFFSYTLALPSKIIHHRGIAFPLHLNFYITLQITILMTRIKIIETLGVLLKYLAHMGVIMLFFPITPLHQYFTHESQSSQNNMYKDMTRLSNHVINQIINLGFKQMLSQ